MKPYYKKKAMEPLFINHLKKTKKLSDLEDLKKNKKKLSDLGDLKKKKERNYPKMM